jgi:hypothetical protein
MLYFHKNKGNTMLKTKKHYLTYISEVKNLLDSIIDTKLSNLKEEIISSELLIPVVGGFSAGKSTLINSFLEENILSTNLTPETALATEIRYSDKNYFEAIKENEEAKIYNLSQKEEIKQNSKNYQYLKLYLNNPKLKEIEPLILVDMPGFDSPIELHNQAILNYLNRGIYFIILMSAEEGTISKTLLREIRNIAEFGKGFSFCISKTNLRPIENVLSIKEEIEEILEDEFDFDREVILIDDNGGESLKKILLDIDVEELFKSIFIDRLKDNYFYIENSLNIKISTLTYSKEDAKKVIESIQESINKLLYKKEQMIENIESKYTRINIDSIISNVVNELITNQEYLLNLALTNQSQFSKEINEIIKTRLIIEIKTKIENISTNIIDDFTIELKELNFKEFEIDNRWIEQISIHTKNLLNSTIKGMGDLSQKMGNKTGVYKTIATILGVTTTILSPIVEVVLIFLPDIISYFTKKTKEKKAKEEILRQFNSQIIPTIKLKIREILPNLFKEEIERLINTISQEFENELQQKQREIEGTLKEKEEKIQNIQSEIEKLESKKREIQTLANQYIFKGV